MSIAWKEKTVAGLKKTWRFTRILTVNAGRRVQILGRRGRAWWQQRRINRALTNLGAQTFLALEQGESNPLTAPTVNEALQKTKKLKEIKEKNCQAIAAIRERIKSAWVAPPPPKPSPSEKPPEGS